MMVKGARETVLSLFLSLFRLVNDGSKVHLLKKPTKRGRSQKSKAVMSTVEDDDEDEYESARVGCMIHLSVG
jgi:hypothetical protein